MDELLTGKLTGFGGITTMKGSFNWSLRRPVTKIVAYWRNDKPGGYSCEIGDIPGHEEGWRKMVAMIVTAVHLLHHLQCTTSYRSVMILRRLPRPVPPRRLVIATQTTYPRPHRPSPSSPVSPTSW